MPKWYVPITIVEYGREALVDAPTRRAARAKVRQCEWDELTDADSFKVTLAKRPTVSTTEDETGLARSVIELRGR